MDNAVELGRRLAEGHVVVDGYIPADSLINFAESTRLDDWSFRSALVRLAQPEPAVVGALLEVVRRLDATLQHAASVLERHVVAALVGPGRIGDPEAGSIELARSSASGHESIGVSADVRAADLGRLVAAGADIDGLLEGYESVADLESEERRAVPLLALAAELDGLADELVAWASDRSGSAPVEVIDETRRSVLRQLDDLGVPVERWSGPGGRR